MEGRGRKVFRKILTLGEWAPLFLVLSSPTPLSISPRGFHVKQAWCGRSMTRGMMAGHRAQAGPQGRHNRPQGRPSMAPRQAQGITRPTGRFINGPWGLVILLGGALSFQGFMVYQHGQTLGLACLSPLCFPLLFPQ